MKRLLLIAAGFFLFSCAGKKDLYDIVRKVPRQPYTPPGTIWLRDNLFIDDAEISNLSWQEFMYWTGKYNPAQYNSILPDTMCWMRADVGEAHDLINYYLRLPYCINYPVVGISYGQALAFCKWRTDIVNAVLYLITNKLKYNPDSIPAYMKRAPQKVLYRLPSKEEWEYAAAAGLDFCNYPMGYERLTDNNNFPVSNTLEYYNYHNKDYVATSMGCSDTLLLDLPTEGVYFGKCNKYGLYNMLGNVAEIIADSTVKGISYSSPVYSITREEDPETKSFSIRSQTYSYRLNQPYKRPEPWIGFRCVAEVLDK
jgi:formylglycine-generating enzyme required for sulfatase activity